MTLDEFETMLPSLRQGVDSETMARLCEITIDVPEAEVLADLDPFSSQYRDKALDLYFKIRRGGADYEPERDENSRLTSVSNVWLDLTPWSFRDPTFGAEFFFSWANILQHLQLGPNSDAHVLEYGPGSGQLILFLARMGVHGYAVDIDQIYLDAITQQATQFGVEMHTERAEFGGGFDGQTFDRILFFEAFHHCLDFLPLLHRLRTRLKPGGMLVMAGEPVIPHETPFLPYPWGPRLDGLSVFCIRNQGWMELGFTEGFFNRALADAGFDVTKAELLGCGRATTFVAEPRLENGASAGVVRKAVAAGLQDPLMPLQAELAALKAENAALKASTSWRVTAPLRRAARLTRGLRTAG